MITHKTIKVETTLEEIKDASEGGYLLSLLNIGDTITLPHKSRGDVEFILADYKNSTAYFVSKRVMFCASMNDTDTTRGGFPQSKIAGNLDSFGAGFGEDAINLIKTRHIRQEIGGETFERDSVFWIPSVVEVFGKKREKDDTEMDVSQFQLFKDECNRIHISCWWLRSPTTGFLNMFFETVNLLGEVSHCLSSREFGVIPCFCI